MAFVLRVVRIIHILCTIRAIRVVRRAVFFFTTFNLVGGMIFLNLFIGVITVGMADAIEVMNVEKELHRRVSHLQEAKGMTDGAIKDYYHAFDLLDIVDGWQLFMDDLRWALDAVYLSPTAEQIQSIMHKSNQESEGDDTDTDNVKCDQFILAMELGVSGTQGGLL